MKRYTFLCLLIACLSCVYAFSQSTSGTISGGVTDASGKFISDASVDIANDATGVVYSTRTNDSGIYFAPILPPGHYHVQVSKRGYKTVIKPDVVLNVESALALNFSLPVGATSESITVDAGASIINTTDASVSTVIDRKFVENIPLNGRSFQDLIALTPGVVTQSPQSGSVRGYSGDFSVNGQRTESNYYAVDGVSANIGPGNGTGAPQAGNSGSLGSSTALGTTQSLISVDALQEFRVQSSTYSAEYGRTPGGQFSMATRAGANVLHGSLFDYLRNNYFDANDWFNDHNRKAMPALRQNDFGGTFGGPIMIPERYDGRNRSFVFASYEGLRLTQPQAASIQYVPDNCMRQDAPASLQPILNAYPIQNGMDYGVCTAGSTTPSLAQFIEPYSLPSRIDSTSIRLDHTISPRLSLFARASYTPTATVTRTLSSLIHTNVNTKTYTLGINSQFAASFSNEFRLGYSLSSAAQTITLDSFGGATPINLASAMGISTYPNSSPEMYLSFSGIGQSILRTGVTENRGQQWNAVDTASLARGKNAFKFGVDYRHIVSPLSPFPASANAEFLSPQAVLNNAATAAVLQKFSNSTPVFQELAVFAQDELHATERFSLSLGLRWEIDPPPTEQNGDDAYTVLGDVNDPSSLTLAPQGTPLWKTSWYNFAPRLGAAWIAHANPDWETVVRAGGGVFFDTDDEVATDGYVSLGFRAFKVVPAASIPIPTADLAFSTAAVTPYTTVYAFPRHLQLPYTLQWNTSVEQALGRQQSLSLSYVASNGRRLLETQQRSVSALNPAFTTIELIQGSVTSNYQALQLKFQRAVALGIQALASYTWSHSLDFGSNASALPLTRGNSDFDVRHNLQAGISWDLPTAQSNKISAALSRGWAVDGRVMARTAFPITLQGSLITDPSTGNTYYGNVDLVPGQPLYLYSSQYPGGRSLNPAAFQATAGTDAGNAPRNFLRGFGEIQTNAAIRRDFALSDKCTLQFRAETFNVFNHPNFGYVDPILTDATFGQATQMLNQSLGTVSPQYQQGGPRSMQFALKLLF